MPVVILFLINQRGIILIKLSSLSLSLIPDGGDISSYALPIQALCGLLFLIIVEEAIAAGFDLFTCE